ncbi:MAG: FadR/GntR family transcriptional regulator [Burkholderiaceae bacterium]
MPSPRTRPVLSDAPPAAAAEARPTGHPVVRAILAYLQERRLQPGDRLPGERALAQQLGVGRNAVREAVAALVTLRIVETRPNSGIYLKRLSSESSFETLVVLADLGEHPDNVQIAQSTEVRSALETLAARLACERADDADLARLDAVLAQTEATLARGGNIVDDDTAFHMAFGESTHNSVLVRVLNAFYRLTAARRRAWFGNPTQGRASATEHRRIVAALRARDAERAQALISRHMSRALAYWQQVLGDQ